MGVGISSTSRKSLGRHPIANTDHIAWLLEGVESWNARRSSGWFVPDFEGADLYREFREAGKLDEDRRIPLSDALLTDAKFTGTNLYRARLDGARLQSANLAKANLMEAILAGAWLQFADLSGAKLTAAEMWKALLQPLPPMPFRPYPLKSARLRGIGQLLGIVRTLRRHHPGDLFYFRGESELFPELRPSVMRDGFHAAEGAMLIDLVSRRPEEFNEVTSALGQWVIAQHYGLRTRFLDISKNPLVSLFHACEQAEGKDGRLHIFAVPKEFVKPYDSDTVSIVANFARLSLHHQEILLGKTTCGCHDSRFGMDEYEDAIRRLYHLIRGEKPQFDQRIDPRDLYRVLVVEPQQSSERIRAQSGAFLFSAFHQRFEREKILKLEGGVPVYVIQVASANSSPVGPHPGLSGNGIPVYAHYSLSIPHARKPRIVEDLQLSNITRETLFPGLDESAKAITESYRALKGTRSTLVRKGRRGRRRKLLPASKRPMPE